MLYTKYLFQMQRYKQDESETIENVFHTKSNENKIEFFKLILLI